MANTETQGKVARKGKQCGVVREFHAILKIKPGHEKAMREDLTGFIKGRRTEVGGLEAMKRIGLYSVTHALFDNDTRYLVHVAFDKDFDPYFDDAFTTVGFPFYETFFRHCEGFPEKGMSGGLSGQAGFEYAKNWAAQNETEVAAFIVTLPDLTVPEQEKAQRLLKAFQKVLDDPQAEQALQHPALKPLLAEASH